MAKPFRCPFCNMELVFTVRMREGFNINPPQKVECPNCQKELTVNLPGQVIGVEKAE
jgi:transcription elongation factor Elf1